MKLRGKNAIITGGARVGITVAKMLAREGMNLLFTYRKSKKIIEKTVRELKKLGVKAFSIHSDVSREKDVKKVLQFAKRKLGSVDIVIAMASSFDLTPFEKLNEKIWNREIANNLTSAFLCGRIAADFIKTGKIIFIGDARVDDERFPYKGRLPYHVAKAGVHMLTKLLSNELAPRIMVNCVAPGLVLPPDKMPKSKARKLAKQTILKRWGTPEDVGEAILLLLKNDYLTGKILYVDE